MTALDLHLAIRRRLEPGMELELFADVLDVFDDQDIATIDEQYTFSSLSDVRPIIGGDPTDLPFLKQVDLSGVETSQPARRNPAYRSPTSRYAPRSVRLGARLTF